jgi:hypothetical protein
MSSAMTNKMLGKVFSDFSGASEVFVDGFSQDIKTKSSI